MLVNGYQNLCVVFFIFFIFTPIYLSISTHDLMLLDITSFPSTEVNVVIDLFKIVLLMIFHNVPKIYNCCHFQIGPSCSIRDIPLSPVPCSASPRHLSPPTFRAIIPLKLHVSYTSSCLCDDCLSNVMLFSFMMLLLSVPPFPCLAVAILCNSWGVKMMSVVGVILSKKIMSWTEHGLVSVRCIGVTRKTHLINRYEYADDTMIALM